ncbi:MAG: hypothetical protein K2J77_11125 [Oscillospiraceae bacterium]|nr:hypothetical protein [Oscillospiraceae bacterium]
MNCALWLNKRKIRHASEIPENLDVASLRGYFLAGSLLDWLLENGGERYAKRLKRISPDDPDLNEKLAAVFGGKADFGKALSSAPLKGSRTQSGFTGSFPSSFAGSFTPRSSFRFTEFGSGSFSYEWLTSFVGFWEFLGKIGSFAFTSWRFTSFGKFHEWEWEWLFELYKRWQSGSFAFTTWSFGSFHQWEWEWLLRLYGGGFGSFSLTSFSSFGSFDMFGLFNRSMGSFELRKFLENLELDEYDRIMFETLMICPLDRFGYGIHNI